MPRSKNTVLRKYFSLRVAILTITILLIFVPIEVLASLRIMPLGDSITKGYLGTYGGYRGYLYDLLVSGGYDFRFVGSLTENSPPTIDPYHEGHAGWRIEEIRDSVQGWLINNPAELVLLHIGTNDMSIIADGLSESEWKRQVEVQVAELSQLLDNIDYFSENTTVILALIISRTDEDQKTYTAYFNQRVREMAEARTDDNIIIVDMEKDADLVYSTGLGGDLRR